MNVQLSLFFQNMYTLISHTYSYTVSFFSSVSSPQSNLLPSSPLPSTHFSERAVLYSGLSKLNFSGSLRFTTKYSPTLLIYFFRVINISFCFSGLLPWRFIKIICPYPQYRLNSSDFITVAWNIVLCNLRSCCMAQNQEHQWPYSSDTVIHNFNFEVYAVWWNFFLLHVLCSTCVCSIYARSSLHYIVNMHVLYTQPALTLANLLEEHQKPAWKSVKIPLKMFEKYMEIHYCNMKQATFLSSRLHSCRVPKHCFNYVANKTLWILPSPLGPLPRTVLNSSQTKYSSIAATQNL